MATFPKLFLLLLTVLVPKVLATDFVVGDKSGWKVGVDYSSWTIGKTFFVGDSLVFKYEKGTQNVLEVNVSTFSQCTKPINQKPLDSGNDVIPLTTPGIKWFISTIAQHCQSGQKLVISVESTPPTPPSSLPPTTLVPVISPSPPFVGQAPPPPPPPPPPASPPSVPPPGRNRSAPHLPIAPTPMENVSPSNSPAPNPTGSPPPTGASVKSAVSAHLGFLAVGVGVLAGIII